MHEPWDELVASVDIAGLSYLWFYEFKVIIMNVWTLLYVIHGARNDFAGSFVPCRHAWPHSVSQLTLMNRNLASDSPAVNETFNYSIVYNNTTIPCQKSSTVTLHALNKMVKRQQNPNQTTETLAFYACIRNQIMIALRNCVYFKLNSWT